MKISKEFSWGGLKSSSHSQNHYLSGESDELPDSKNRNSHGAAPQHVCVFCVPGNYLEGNSRGTDPL